MCLAAARWAKQQQAWRDTRAHQHTAQAAVRLAHVLYSREAFTVATQRCQLGLWCSHAQPDCQTARLLLHCQRSTCHRRLLRSSVYAVSAAPVTPPTHTPVLSRSGAAASRWPYLAGSTRASFSADTASCRPPAGAHSKQQTISQTCVEPQQAQQYYLRAATGESSITTHTTQSKAAGCTCIQPKELAGLFLTDK